LHAFVKQTQGATESGNVDEYVSIMASNATWDGPMGENAIGPDNIRRAVNLAFENWGRLRTLQAQFKFLTPYLVFADMYQRAGSVSSRGESIAVAPGSVGPPRGSNLRTTLLLRKENDEWRVIAVRIADLRSSETHSDLSAKTNASLPVRH
jgi:ketosteroid isomerase-like protein